MLPFNHEVTITVVVPAGVGTDDTLTTNLQTDHNLEPPFDDAEITDLERFTAAGVKVNATETAVIDSSGDLVITEGTPGLLPAEVYRVTLRLGRGERATAVSST